MKKYGVALAVLLLAACGGGGGSSGGPGSNIAELAKNAGPITPEGEAVAQGALGAVSSSSNNTTSSSGSSSKSVKSLGLSKETFSLCDGLTMDINESTGNITIRYENVDFSECFSDDLLQGAIFNGSMTISGENPIITSGNIDAEYNDTPVEITQEDDSVLNALMSGTQEATIAGRIELSGEEISSVDYTFSTTGDVDLSGDVNANVVYDIDVTVNGNSIEDLETLCSGQMVITRDGSSPELCNVNGDCTGCL